MFRKITDLIVKSTSVKTVAVSAALIVLFEAGFGIFTPAFTEATGGPLLDMSVGYSAEYAYQRLESINQVQGIYFNIRLIDFFFPSVYAFALSVLSCFIYRKKYDAPDNYRWILIVPFLGAVFDYAENIILVILYRSLPLQYPAAATACNITTIIKFGLIGLSILLIVTGGLSLLKGGDSMLLHGNRFKGGKKDENGN